MITHGLGRFFVVVFSTNREGKKHRTTRVRKEPEEIAPKPTLHDAHACPLISFEAIGAENRPNGFVILRAIQHRDKIVQLLHLGGVIHGEGGETLV